MNRRSQAWPVMLVLLCVLLMFFVRPSTVPMSARNALAYPVPPGVSTPTEEEYPTPPPGVSTPSAPVPTIDPDETPPPGVSTPTATHGPVYVPLVIEPDS